MSSDPALSVRGVSKTYRIGLGASGHFARHQAGSREFHALQDVSFDVAEGEIVGIIGRNGAGKSTLLKLLTRITAPDAGEIDVRGRVGSLLEVGTGFHPELTGRENVFLNGAILGMRRGEISRRFDDIVAFSEIDQFLDTPVKRYSSGMYVRLAFAVAAHLDAEVMIVDEVLAVGDAGFQAKCMAKIESLARDEGRTVLFVSHSMTAIQQLCERVLLLDQGRLVSEGAASVVIPQYLAALAPSAESSSDGVWDLANHHNEHGDVVFQELRLSSAGLPVEVVTSGSALRISVRLHLTGPVRHAVMGVSLATDAELAVASMTSLTMPQLFADASGLTTVHVDLPRVPLTPGLYYVYLGLSSAPGGPMFDQVQRAGSIRVVDDQLDDAEFFRMRGHGFVTLDASWSHD